jgi:hypothetical protein
LAAFSLALPAIVHARAAAENPKDVQNIKQIVLALHNHHDAYGHLPAGVDDLGFSASAKLLPFIEQDKLYKTIDFKKPFDDPANAAARKTVVKAFLSPRDPLGKVVDAAGATNYLYNDQVFSQNSKMKLVGITDGTSNTIGVGETLKGDGGDKAKDVARQHIGLKKEVLDKLKADGGVKDWKDGKNVVADRCASWMDGHFLQGTFNGVLAPNDEKPDVSCEGLGGVSALRSLNDNVPVGMLDGSVHYINAKKLSLDTYRAALTPNGGEILGADW